MAMLFCMPIQTPLFVYLQRMLLEVTSQAQGLMTGSVLMVATELKYACISTTDLD